MNKILLRSCLLSVVALMGIQGKSSAQLSNCNVFLKGNYVEAGINWNGAFGSSTPPPSGYHNDTSSALYNSASCGGAVTPGAALGFVADPEKNGWTTGTPGYFGDYLLPSGPQEGWSLFADGVQYDVWNFYAQHSDTLPGGMVHYGVTTYEDSGSYKRATMQFQIGGTIVTQKAVLNMDSLRIDFQLLIDNTSTATVSNVFYMRTINAHCDEMLSHSLATRNLLVDQATAIPHRSYVSATGTGYGKASVALSSTDTRTKAFIDKHSTLPTAVTIDNIYFGDSNYLYTVNDSTTANTAIGLIFNIGNMPSGAGDSTGFTYYFTPRASLDTGNAVHDVVNEQYSVYPNPATNNLQIKGLERSDNIALFDLPGREMTGFIVNNHDGSFNAEKLPAGSYVLLVRDSNGNVKKRLQLQKL